ncbi:MAG: hypothetical protein M0R17_04310 [Candidatus Omnitrophica bacterium]|jgi:hypothetical protein|nr:hypothetical protein [Candidatus Omnitrophota bacterium]
MKFENFTLLDYGDYYYARKKCSVTGELYSVKLTKDEYHHYYLAKGKNTKHLVDHSKEDKLFLETTLTPEEVKLLSKEELKSDKRSWKKRLRLKNKDLVKKELVDELLKE